MATPNLKLKPASPQGKQLVVIQTLDLWALKDGLNTIRAIRDVMDYLGEDGKTDGANVGIIFAGLGEALKVAHDRMVRAMQEEEEFRRTVSVRPFEKNGKAAGGGAARGGKAAPAVAKMQFTVVLTEVGSDKINVIKAVREVTSLGLKESKDLVDGAPQTVKEGVTKEEATTIKKRFEDAGAKVEIKAGAVMTPVQ